MSKHRRRRTSSPRSFVRRHMVSAASILSEHPLRACGIGLLCVAALWIVLTKSLPYALAPHHADAALALNPNNPIALIAKAEEKKKKLVELLGLDGEASKEQERTETDSANVLFSLPEATLPKAKSADKENESAGEREQLSAEIRDLALRVIANDPLNATAFRLLAEATTNTEQIRLLMQEAFKRSRRESSAAFWLLNDSIYRKDFVSAIRYSDILLRTRPALEPYVFAYLSLLAEAPEARDLLLAKLENAPRWRLRFFHSLPANLKSVTTLLAIVTALKDKAKPVLPTEIKAYLNFLIRRGQVDVAYDIWLQFLPAADVENLGFLTNANFQNQPSGLPFDWTINDGVNALAEITPLEAGGDLHVTLNDGRVKFPVVSQVLILPPGRYRLEGKLRGAVTGKRGLRWQLLCTASGRRSLGETEMLVGRTDQWRVFSFYAEVPRADDCRGQTLRLFHDARSASEELISGEIWFSDLRVERVPSKAAQWTPGRTLEPNRIALRR
jgi:hypothetical protein